MALEGPPPGREDSGGTGSGSAPAPRRKMTVRRPAASPSSPSWPTVRNAHRLQRRRHWMQAGFFAFFVLAPALNLLRFDLNETQLWVLGMRWSLGIDAFTAGQISAAVGFKEAR